MPGSAHFLYIPGILLLGLVVGWIMGSRATRGELQRQASREADRAARREARRARAAEGKPGA